jgi:Domain of unknown function (DUF1905)/Bacteriocin-protection, YdeI or OmpD-Associated
MIRLKAKILQFDQQGEKTGWSYIRIPGSAARKLLPDNKKSFRVKGLLDDHAIGGVALLPMGDGDFIMAVNATMRKAIRKQKGDFVHVELAFDQKKIEPPKDLLECLADEPRAKEYFSGLVKSHQNYFGKWVGDAKTESTRARRIARVIDAMLKKMDFGQMVRAQAEERKQRDR